ncbi:MAG: PAS domain S-box protein [Mariprofundaceae bacterium]
MSDSLGGILDLKSRLSRAMDSVEEHQQKLVEKKSRLKEQQAQYYRLLNALHEVYYSADMQGNITEISPSIGEVAGYDCEEIVGKPATFFYKYVEDRQVMLETLQKDGFIVDYELELIHHDGSSLYASLNVHVVTDEQGKPTGVEGLLRDITDRVALEDQLRAVNKSLEERVRERTAELESKNEQLQVEINEKKEAQKQLKLLSTAISYAAEGVIITDPTGQVEYVNTAFEEINGYSRDEIMGENLSILNSNTHNQSFVQNFWNTISSGETWEGTFTNQRKDGSHYPALMNVSPVLNSEGKNTHYIAIQQDMTEQNLLDAKYRQSQKMDALGTLVGGIAHDFNNTLSGMLMHLYLAKKATSETLPAVTDRLQQIETLGKNASEMLKQLMAFARQEQVTMKPLSLKEFLTEGLRLVQVSVPENIKIHTLIDDDELCINGDITQLQQVLINLLNNARDALEGLSQPYIEISLKRVEANENFVRLHPEISTSKLACLTVKDSGCGMPEKTKERIFDPFFTTKGEGKGNGLGLAMVYGTIQQHGGIVEVESEQEKGTSISLYFPLHEKDTSACSKAEDPLKQGKGETILLVDDNMMVRSITSDLLESLGYHVIQAEDGLDALKCFDEQCKEIGLVIMDVVMPNMGGIDAAFKLREQSSSLPIIFMSGYDQEQAITMHAIENTMSLPKPLIPVSLSQSIRKLLD